MLQNRLPPRVVFEPPGSQSTHNAHSYRRIDLYRYRDDTPHARWLDGTLTASIILLLADAGLIAWLISLGDQTRDPLLRGGEGAPVLRVADYRQWLQWAQILVALAGLVAWLLWQHRVHTNLLGLGHRTLRFSPMWGIAWYFIPLANLFMPWLVLVEIYRRSSFDAGDAPRRSVLPVYLLWLLVLLPAAIWGYIIMPLQWRARVWSDVREALLWTIVLIGNAVAVIVMTMVIVRTIRADQRAQARAMNL